MAKAPLDKRVFHIRVENEDPRRWRLVAVSADATLQDLHLILLGTFQHRGNFTKLEKTYRFVFASGDTFEDGRGSRTALRRVLGDGVAFSYRCEAAEFSLRAVVNSSEIVATRRHYPKILACDDSVNARVLTWRVQDISHRYYRSFEREVAEAAKPSNSQSFRHGLFSAVISGPVVAPSMWIPMLISDNVKNEAEAQSVVMDLFQEHNAIAQLLQGDQDRYRSELEAMIIPNSTGYELIYWARGYLTGMSLCGDAWKAAMRDPHWSQAFAPIATVLQLIEDDEELSEWNANPRLTETLGRAVAMSAITMRELWRERLFPGTHSPMKRGTPKISPNAPCTCGSGKKYKRCCSPLRAIP